MSETSPPMQSVLAPSIQVGGAAANVVGAAILLAGPALWNGYPIVFFDSLDYFWMSLTGEFVVSRTMPYGAFLALTHLRMSLWLTVAVQCLLTAYVLREALAVFVPSRPNRLLIPVTMLLCLLTALPWYTGQIMPDMFAGLAPLAVITVLYGRGVLGRVQQWALGAIALIAATVHTSHLLLFIGLVASVTFFAFVAPRIFSISGRQAGSIALLGAASIGSVIALHGFWGGHFVMSQSGSVFMLARFMQDGLAQRYLEDVCPRTPTAEPPPFRLCAVRDRLPLSTNQFLWNHEWGGNSPFMELGGWRGLPDEAAKVVAGSLRAYPVDHLIAVLENVILQLRMSATGDGFEKMEWIMRNDIRRTFPAESDAFLGARQHQEPPVDFSYLNAIHLPVLWGAYLGLVLLVVIGWKRRDAPLTGLATLLLLAVLGNAFICGVFSNPNHRYQSRITWIAVFGLTGGILRMVGTDPGRRPFAQEQDVPTQSR